jgi:hypothetical protein
MMPAVPTRVAPVTPAEPDQDSTTRVRLKAAALGVVGALLVPLPAAAAPAGCEQPLRYAAQSGAQLMRIADLDLDVADRADEPIKDITLGEVKSALVAQSPINAAGLGRMLDGGPADRKALTAVVRQTAPPSHPTPERQSFAAAQAGPYRLGKSELTVQARWDPRMACGQAAGEVTRAETEVRRAGVLEDGDGSLVRVPGKISGLSTTAMERTGPAARAVAAASMAGGKVELLGGAIEVRIVRPPSLLATMSGTDGGEVRYRPAVLEVSGDGFETARLDTAGDNVELRLDEDGDPEAGTEGGPAGNSRTTAENGTAEKSSTRTESDTAGVRSSHGKPAHGLSGTLRSAGPLPLPAIPAVPPMPPRPDTEVAPAGGPGTTVEVSLGDMRQAVLGHAIAAKATALTIVITKRANPRRADHRGGVLLDLDLGLLEAAAVAPEPAVSSKSAPVGAVGGEGGGGLPITGPRAEVVALTGLALVIAGAAALGYGLRGRFRA